MSCASKSSAIACFILFRWLRYRPFRSRECRAVSSPRELSSCAWSDASTDGLGFSRTSFNSVAGCKSRKQASWRTSSSSCQRGPEEAQQHAASRSPASCSSIPSGTRTAYCAHRSCIQSFYVYIFQHHTLCISLTGLVDDPGCQRSFLPTPSL